MAGLLLTGPEGEAGPGRQHRRQGAPVLAGQHAPAGPALGTLRPAAVLQGSLGYSHGKTCELCLLYCVQRAAADLTAGGAAGEGRGGRQAEQQGDQDQFHLEYTVTP